MAASRNFLDDIRKELECPVCQEQFSEQSEPKILKCQHTFCQSCLNDWLRKHGGGRLSCPNCRVITECPDNNIDCLPTNLTCRNLGDILKAHGGSNNGDCKDIRSQEENICKRHKKNLEHYCEQCQICICSDCVIVEHRDANTHKIVSVEDRAKIQGALITEKLRSVDANTSQLRSDIATLVERREKFNNNIDQATKVVRKEANFIVTTKDAKGLTTYSEIDKVAVEVTSVRKGIKNIPVVIKDLKDGRYSVSYTPNASGEFGVSIKVRDELIRESPFELFIHKSLKPKVFKGAKCQDKTER
ncbi:Tripartite motif-containing protein 2 [Stylophora pistillata]|uniref:Tripartite motif-containing protein 2 n=1 Tax=Stylophora pistillata TaxID=50429 RepID=A0A2B4R695_STYPI|nr:Tripartite motif-containing protein 2 [Stylophora pistillata]